MSLSRRGLLTLVALGLAGCGPPAPEASEVPVVPPPDVAVERLSELATVVGLDWMLLLSPASLWATPWLAPSLGRILRDERLDVLAQSTGVDLRTTRELVLASYDDGGAIAYLVRHDLDPIDVERRFRERLTSAPERVVHGHQLVTVFGKLGTAERGFASIGRDVAVFQYGGPRKKGPATIAAQYALGRLEAIPTALDESTLTALHVALGAPPIELLWPGPFDGELARGARGLFAGATAVALGARPSSEGTLALTIILAGDFAGDPEAERFLDLAWTDLATSDLGHLLALDRPRRSHQIAATPLGLILRVDLDAALLVDGLAAATIENVREIMNGAPPPPDP